MGQKAQGNPGDQYSQSVRCTKEKGRPPRPQSAAVRGSSSEASSLSRFGSSEGYIRIFFWNHQKMEPVKNMLYPDVRCH
jgi:hypothetical protein